MNKLRILHVIDKLHGGGAEVQLSYLVNNSNLDHAIIYNIKGGESSISGDCQLFCLEEKNKFKLVKKLSEFIRKYECDIVQGWLPEYFSLIAGLSCLFSKKKYISCDRRAPVNKLSKLYFRDRLKILSHIMSDRVVANFDLGEFGPISRLFLRKTNFCIIENGYRYLKNDYEKNHEGSKEFFFVGRLVDQKRPLLVIDIFDFICTNDNNNNHKLKIFGDGPLMNKLLDRIASSENKEKIEVFGYCKDWLSHLRSDALLIYPSVREGMPNIIFESVLAGNAFLASNISEIAIHFTQVPEVFVDINSSEIENFHKRYLNYSLNSSNIKKKLYDAVKGFTVDKMVENWEVEYHNITESSRA